MRQGKGSSSSQGRKRQTLPRVRVNAATTGQLPSDTGKKKEMLRYYIQPAVPPELVVPDFWSCGPDTESQMISRRRILSRSRDELNSDYLLEEEEDVWYQKEKLYKDHIQEVLNKWEQIDDEIWAKIICLERNRRVAKAYARAPVLTINGSDDGFDGYRIGLCGFDNPMRDPKTEEVKRHIGHGVKIKMDEAGNIMVKRAAKSNVYIKEMTDEGPSAAAGKLLEPDKPVRLFDIKRFQSNVSRELRRAYPDRRKLESQCLSVVGFVKDAAEVLDCPCWVMIVNIVALDMLKSKLPIASTKRQTSAPNLQSIFEQRPRLPLPQDEDPYSLPNSSTTNTTSSSSRGGYGTTTTSSSGNNNNKPPQLPPRDLPQHPAVPKPDYEDHRNDNFKFPAAQSSRKKLQARPDDPYYCGLSARVPNFAKKPSPMEQQQQHAALRKSHSAGYLSFLRGQEQQLSRNPYGDTGSFAAQYTDFRSNEDTYGQIYGRLPLRPMAPTPFSQYQHYRPREVFVGEWE